MLESVVGKDFLPRGSGNLSYYFSLCHTKADDIDDLFGSNGIKCNALYAGIVTRRPLVLQLHKIEGGKEYAEFMHLPRKRFEDFGVFLFPDKSLFFLFFVLAIFFFSSNAKELPHLPFVTFLTGWLGCYACEAVPALDLYSAYSTLDANLTGSCM